MTAKQLAADLVRVGQGFYSRGWVMGTSGNFSAVLRTRPLRLLITPSAAHKGRLSARTLLQIDGDGRVKGRGPGKPSAETLLHLEIVRARGAGAVLHTHSVWSTILSEQHIDRAGLAITGYEMLKGLDGVTTHEHQEWLPILANDQDMTRLSARLRETLIHHPAVHAVLLGGHGMYTWGRTIDEAERHVEILEFLLEVVGGRAMAVVKIPTESRVVEGHDAVRAFLATQGIDYERAVPGKSVPEGAPAAELLDAYKGKIDELKTSGEYVTADVIDVFPHTPNLDVMLNKFNSEHWHDEDEVRFIVEGRGLFHIHPKDGAPVFAIEVEAGDLIRVPRGTHHWFDLCADRRIRAIRLFQDPSGWTPHYTESGVDKNFQPVCFGPAYFPTALPPARSGGGV